METTFVYDKPVDGKDFISRNNDQTILKNLIFQGESVAVYDEPKTGKTSLIHRVLTRARVSGENFVVAEVSLMRARTAEDVLLSFASALIGIAGSSPVQYRKIIAECLSGTHFVFDEALFSSTGRLIDTNWVLDEIDIRKVFELPTALASRLSVRVITYVSEFQNILRPEESDKLLRELQKIVERHDTQAPFLFTGSHFNAMREIFDCKRWFWRSAVRFHLTPLETSDVANFIYKRLQDYGKVIDRELIVKSSRLLRMNPWYICHLFSIVDQMAKGYVNPNIIEDALANLLSLHQPHFYRNVCNLTDFQLSLLKAIIDGESRFSSSQVIDRYNLNSSANVKRLKDALIKKEIVWFDEEESPHIQDVLFEYWLRNVYFFTGK